MKTKKIIAILLLVIFFITQFNFIGFINPVSATTKDENIVLENEHYKYYYSQLSEQAKNIYDAMCEMYVAGQLKTGNANYDLVANGKVSAELINAYKKGNNELIIAFETARDAFYLDYPEVFYINMEKYSMRITADNNGYHVWLGTGNNDSYYLTGFTNVNSVNNAETEYEIALNSIVDGAKALSSEYSDEELVVKQVEYVHSSVIISATYKLDDVCDVRNMGHIRTPYGALVAHEAVCEGYSKAMKVALDKLGIPCILVRGIYKYGSYDIERHMWTYVQVSGKWYAVDATFDDPDCLNQLGEEQINKDYFLAGQSFMSVGHYTEGIMSAPEFEFTYPELEYDTYGVREIVNVNGLEIKYSSLDYQGDTVAVLDASFNGMNFEDAKNAGYHFIVRYYYSQEQADDKWLYIDPILYPSIIYDGEKSFSLTISSIPYVELAVVDIPMDERAHSNDLYESSYYQRFLGDESMFLAYSGILELPDANYIAPPRFVSASPYIETKLKAGVTTHIKVTYDKDLVQTSDEPSCYLTTKNAWTSSAVDNSKISNFKWDGVRTIEFDFTPSTQYGDNSVIYYFNVKGLVATDSGKVPTPAYYYVQETFGCTYSMAKAGAWRIYGRPTLIDDGTVSVEGWNLSDGTTISKEEAEKLNGITDKLALVVNKTTDAQETKMNDLIANETNSRILSSETYNINLIICNRKVLSTANNDKVTVYLGFPEGYGPNDAGVTFKAYHFKTENGELVAVEEIGCVVTPYGLLVTCDAFSPFEVVALETSEEDLANTAKSIVITSDSNGIVEGLDNNVVTLNSGESKTYTVKANDGYQINSVTVLGKEITEAIGNDSYDITINYEDITDANNIVNVSFVAKTVVQEEVRRGEELVVPTVEVAKIADMPELIIANVGEKVTITPVITPSNGIDTYQWYKDGEELIGETSSELTINKVVATDEGNYTLAVTSTVDAVSEKVLSTACKLLTSDFDISLEATKKAVVPGEIFEVNAYLKNLRNIKDGIVAITGQLEFDTSLVEIYKVNEEVDALVGEDGWNLNAFNYDNFKFVADNGKYITDNSHIFTVYLKAKDIITSEQDLKIALKNVSASGGNGVILPVSNAEETVHVQMKEEVEEITSEKYLIDDETAIISRILPNTTVTDFRNNVETNQTILFTNTKGQVLADTDKITTGTSIKVGKSLEYTLVVIGDIDCDGDITVNDLAQVKLHLIDKQKLSGINLIAADIDGVDDVTINDIAQIKLVLIGKLILK